VARVDRGVHRGDVLRKVIPLLSLGCFATGLVLAAAVRAAADDGPIVVHGDRRGVVDTRVTSPGHPGRSAKPANQPADASATVTCRYYKRYYETSIPGGRTIDLGGPTQTPRGPGQWWLQVCSDGSRDVVFVPAGVDPNVAAPLQTPGMLAVQAYNQLRLPTPAVGFNPARPTSVGPATSVHLATWWWVRGWSVRRQRTAAGAVWAVVTARPVRSEFDPGDGGEPVVCTGPGRVWTPAAAGSGSACSSVYEASSAGQPGLVYRASVSVSWQVSWVGAGGAAGSLPALMMTAAFPVAVMERESVVVEAGGGR
jgi:hypothetical protein